MFLLLCLPQLQDWQSQKSEEKRTAIIEPRSTRYRFIRPMVEWKFKWTYDIPVGAAATRLAAIFCTRSSAYVELS